MLLILLQPDFGTALSQFAEDDDEMFPARPAAPRMH